MKLQLVLLASLSGYVSCQNDNVVKSALSDADIKAIMTMEVPEQIRYFGYPAETHAVVTDDGYSLTIVRVPRGKGQQFDNRCPVILLQHGCFCHSREFILTGPGHALGFIFADAGFDVWVLNSRGTKYSRKHATLDPDRQRAFWAYSFHEIGVYDLAKVIDYVLGFREAGALVHVGYSEGSTAYYALMSVKPEYNEKVSVHYSLAPIAYFRHFKNLVIDSVVFNYDTVKSWAESANIYEVTRNSPVFDYVSSLCHWPTFSYLCKITMFAFAGIDFKHFDDRLLPLIWASFPMSTSYQQFLHHLQNTNTGEFRQFDYGLAKNLQVYNASVPPAYNLSLISSRVRLLYSCNDMLSSCEDIDYLYRLLPNAEKIKIAWADWNHLDYIFGTGIKTYLADPILEDLRTIIEF